ncbi:MAG: [Fe-Fe] hydrogenase large subunit C-terminal domain-containing protein [bacterium]|nr:[Fe-Fe] hydrogenase large subunit C-terminal domain-containing protein [bacterium]
MSTYFHSVQLDEEKCRGCTNCVKCCPTEAIRVRHGKAIIDNIRCIDCGECIRACPNRAKSVHTDPKSMRDTFKYTIALPAPSLFAQFPGEVEPGKVLSALKESGFSHVFEVAIAAEIAAEAIEEYVSGYTGQFPLISTSCPTVVRLIQVRFPEMIKHLIPIEAPMEIAACISREEVIRETGCFNDEIGAFFISPCPAKVTAVHQPVGLRKSCVDGVFSLADIYADIYRALPRVIEETPVRASAKGLNWARGGGESEGINIDEYLAVDGIEHVISVLEEIEMGKLKNLKFIELQSCTEGCVGGVLTVENPFVAKVRLGRIVRKLAPEPKIKPVVSPDAYIISGELEARPILKLDDDVNEALCKMAELEKIVEILPGLDCAACGAPHCRALAEDIVRGNAHLTDCVFVLRKRVKELVTEMMDLTERLPPVMGKREKE